MQRQGKAIGGQTKQNVGQCLAQCFQCVQCAPGVCQGVAGAGNADDAQVRHLLYGTQGGLKGFFRLQQPGCNARARFVDAGIAAVAKSALHIAARSYRQVRPAEGAVGLGIETGMPRTVGLGYGHALLPGFMPNRIQSLGHDPTQSPQFVQFSSSGRVRMRQARLHWSQSLHSCVL